jgi:hypothetical protein
MKHGESQPADPQIIEDRHAAPRRRRPDSKQDFSRQDNG